MDNVFIVAGVLAALAVMVVGFGVYSVYGGVHASLKTAKAGEIYNFSYLQPVTGDPERFLAKVLDVHTLDDYSIKRLNARSKYRKHDPEFMRTSHLVTCQMPNGSVRNFYAERTINCRKPLLAGAFFRNAIAATL